MWYRIAKNEEGTAETIIRRLVEQQVRKRLFLGGEQYLPKGDVARHVKRLMKELLNKYGDYDLIRQKENILDYDKFIKEFVEKRIRIFEDKKPIRKAGYDDNDILYCDECGISEDKINGEIDYNKWINKYLCPECAERLEDEHQEFLNWQNLSPQEQDIEIQRAT